METLRFERRFRGFESGALGGYAAGAVVADRIDGPAEVNLRSLPPMDQQLELKEAGDGSLRLLDGETLILDATPISYELDVPGPLTLSEAEEANRRLIHDEVGHLYPGCFTCGPDRGEGDGLRLFMGRTDEDGLIAAAWTPHTRLGDRRDELGTEFVWAALDCPSIWASGSPTGGPWAEGLFRVLARQRLEQLARVPLGEPAIVTAWPIAAEGRKYETGTAIHDPDGQLLARADSLLVEVPRPE